MEYALESNMTLLNSWYRIELIIAFRTEDCVIDCNIAHGQCGMTVYAANSQCFVKEESFIFLLLLMNLISMLGCGIHRT